MVPEWRQRRMTDGRRQLALDWRGKLIGLATGLAGGATGGYLLRLFLPLCLDSGVLLCFLWLSVPCITTGCICAVGLWLVGRFGTQPLADGEGAPGQAGPMGKLRAGGARVLILIALLLLGPAHLLSWGAAGSVAIISLVAVAWLLLPRVTWRSHAQ